MKRFSYNGFLIVSSYIRTGRTLVQSAACINGSDSMFYWKSIVKLLTPASYNMTHFLIELEF